MIYYSDGSSTIDVKSAYCVADDVGNILEHVETIPYQYTNNEEEYRGVIAALKRTSSRDIVYSDSKLVVYQIANKWKLNKVHLFPLCQEAQKLIRLIGSKVEWVPRELNLAGHFFDKKKKSK